MQKAILAVLITTVAKAELCNLAPRRGDNKVHLVMTSALLRRLINCIIIVVIIIITNNITNSTLY